MSLLFILAIISTDKKNPAVIATQTFEIMFRKMTASTKTN